jgi:Tetratricopeptide repeat
MSDLGNALLAAGKADESITAYEGALKRFRATGDRAGEARTLTHPGAALMRPGRQKESADAFRAAGEVFAALGDQAGTERAAKNPRIALNHSNPA